MDVDTDFDTFEVIYEDAILKEFDHITTLEVFLNSVSKDERKTKTECTNKNDFDNAIKTLPVKDFRHAKLKKIVEGDIFSIDLEPWRKRASNKFIFRVFGSNSQNDNEKISKNEMLLLRNFYRCQ